MTNKMTIPAGTTSPEWIHILAYDINSSIDINESRIDRIARFEDLIVHALQIYSPTAQIDKKELLTCQNCGSLISYCPFCGVRKE